MKKKALLALSIVTTAVLLSACGNNTTGTAETDTTEISTTETDSTDTNTDTNAGTESKTGQAISISNLDWIELGSLTTYESLRAEWDSILGITGTTGNKEGMLYVTSSGKTTQNGFLGMAIRTQDFVEFVAEDDNYNALVDAVRNSFADSEDLTDQQLFAIGLNAYFNLLPTEDESESHANDFLSRAQLFALINRANNPVPTEATAETDGHEMLVSKLESMVGESIYNDSASGAFEGSYLVTQGLSDGLDAETYNASISRGEAIYTIMQTVYPDASLDYDSHAYSESELSEAVFSDAINGGNIKSEQNLSSNAEEISYALQNPDNGCPVDIYIGLLKANEIGVIEDETAWDEAITLSDAISLYYDIAVYKYYTYEKTKYSTDEIAESENWPEYKETMEYYVSNGLITAATAHALNPDIYGVETYGKSSDCLGTTQCSPNLGVYIKELDLTTTKGYNIIACWYTETNTVQYIYDAEALPGGGILADLTSSDALEEAYPQGDDVAGGTYNYTHQQKIEVLGEPGMTDEEVINEITNGTVSYVKRLVLETTKGYNIQACWNMKDNTVEYIYPGDIPQYDVYRGSFMSTSDALALAGKYSGTRQEKMDVVGEPSMTEEEVIAALKEKYDMD
jgi:hypothetical protein